MLWVQRQQSKIKTFSLFNYDYNYVKSFTACISQVTFEKPVLLLPNSLASSSVSGNLAFSVSGRNIEINTHTKQDVPRMRAGKRASTRRP